MEKNQSVVRPIHVDVAIAAHALSTLGALLFSMSALLKVLHETGSVPTSEPSPIRQQTPSEPISRSTSLPKNYFDL